MSLPFVVRLVMVRDRFQFGGPCMVMAQILPLCQSQTYSNTSKAKPDGYVQVLSRATIRAPTIESYLRYLVPVDAMYVGKSLQRYLQD